MMRAVVENGDVLVVGLVNTKDWIAVLDRLAVEEQIMQICDKAKWEGNLKSAEKFVLLGWYGGMEGFQRGSGGRWAKLEARGPKVPGSGTLQAAERGRGGPLRPAIRGADKTLDKCWFFVNIFNNSRGKEQNKKR